MVETLVDQAREVDALRLNALLRARHPDADVVGVRVLDESDGSASRLRLEVDYAPGRDAGLPPTIFLKRNLARFTFPPEMYATEVRIYRDVLPGLDIESPEVFAIEAAPGDVRFTILMEDLATRPGGRLGIVTDPATPEEVAAVLDTLVSLHAAYWGGDRLDREVPWMRGPTEHAAMRFWREIGPRLTHRHLDGGHRAALVDSRRWPEEALWVGFERLVTADAGGPHTLLHGDVHAGNVYYDGRGAGGLIDWQLALRGSWALDVTYLLVTALDPAARAAHERDLLVGYLSGLRAAGVDPPPWDEAWLRYRQNVLYGIAMWLITPDGVHSDEVQDLSLQRCLLAGEALGTLAALGVDHG
jgi:hypothetical protein